MLRRKFLATFLIVLAVLFVQVGSVLAAPELQETTPIAGTVQTIRILPGVDGGDPIVIVTVLDDLGATQTVRLSLESAAGLGLIQTDELGQPVLDPETGLPTVNDLQLEQPISIDPTLVISDEDPFNPIAGLLATFFGTTNAEINQMHADGFGFGVIAQALWIATDTDGNTDPLVASDILLAKQNKDFEAFFTAHPEYAEELGDNLPGNWGQFKKVLRSQRENLGSIVSGHAENGEENTNQPGNGNGNGRGNGNGNGNGNGHGNGNGNGNGNRP